MHNLKCNLNMTKIKTIDMTQLKEGLNSSNPVSLIFDVKHFVNSENECYL